MTLRIVGTKEAYELQLVPRVGPPRTLGKLETKFLSPEVAGGFTGVHLGLYATGNGRPALAPADFARYEYRPAP